MEEFLCQDPVVSLNLAVVLGCVGPNELVLGDTDEFPSVFLGPVARRVIGH